LRGTRGAGTGAGEWLPRLGGWATHSRASAGASAAEPPHRTSRSSAPSRLAASAQPCASRSMVRRRLTPKFSRMRRRRNPADAPQPGAACRLQRYVRPPRYGQNLLLKLLTARLLRLHLFSELQEVSSPLPGQASHSSLPPIRWGAI
jgi:hypothetical protein